MDPSRSQSRLGPGRQSKDTNSEALQTVRLSAVFCLFVTH